MKIDLHNILVKDIVNGYFNNDESGVVGYGGKLDIRPPYQREFVYDEKQQQSVINSVINEFPLNVMYWCVRDDGTYEVLDGQQRTLSICEYVNNNFSVKYNKFDCFFLGLPADIQEKILNYKLTIYFCEGEPSEKLSWFETVNIAGEKLYPQEIRNAVYAGSFVTDAKRYFSKSNCPAYGLASKYMKGSTIRQEYLQTVLNWISNGKIEAYMGNHQYDENATPLWEYFKNVIDWVETLLPNCKVSVQGVPWGVLYNEYHENTYDSAKLEEEVQKLMADDDVTNKSGIYEYIFDRKEKHLNIRAFTDKEKKTMYARQKGKCKKCKKDFGIKEMEADHIKPWCEGGATDIKNGQMLCRECNRRKSNK